VARDGPSSKRRQPSNDDQEALSGRKTFVRQKEREPEREPESEMAILWRKLAISATTFVVEMDADFLPPFFLSTWPSSQHTEKKLLAGGGYAFVDSGGPGRRPGDVASMAMQWNFTRPTCLAFWVSHYGTGVGGLR